MICGIAYNHISDSSYNSLIPFFESEGGRIKKVLDNGMVIVESKYHEELSGSPVFKHSYDMVVVGLVSANDKRYYHIIPIDNIK